MQEAHNLYYLERYKDLLYMIIKKHIKSNLLFL